jgi:hypothetical protein
LNKNRAFALVKNVADDNKHIKLIKNPLTVVGLFSSIAEVAGTIVLLKLPPELQSLFIWFVMLFPVLLVVAFFLTLNFNPTVLYAPSDFITHQTSTGPFGTGICSR